MVRTRSRTRWTAAALAVAAGVGLSSLAQPADAAVAAVGSPAILSNIGNVVIGTVMKNGHADPGAVVTPLLWPNSDTLDTMADNATVATIPLSPATTDANGNFAVQLVAATTPASYFDSQGHADIELIVGDASISTDWAFTATRNLRTGGWTSASEDAVGGTAMEAVVLDVGASTSTELVGSEATGFSNGTMTAAAAEAAGAADGSAITEDVSVAPLIPNPGPRCTYYAGAALTNRAEPFMHVYPGKHAPATALQEFGVNHGVGIATNFSSKWVGGAAGGTINLSLKARADVTLTANSTVFNALNFRRFTNLCGWAQERSTSVHAILNRIDAAAEPDFTSCNSVPIGSNPAKASGKDVTFKAQVNVGPVSVNAQSGWNSLSSVTWHIKAATNLCGSSSLGWASAAEAEANSL
jgi:hypothetical protein